MFVVVNSQYIVVYLEKLDTQKWICIECSPLLPPPKGVKGGGGYWFEQTQTNRVLARISKMPVQNSKFKISAHPDLAINLIQILIPTTINSLLYQEGQSTLQLCLRIWFLSEEFGQYKPKAILENSW